MKKIYILIMLLMVILGNLSYGGTWQDTVSKRARERGISYAEAEKQLNKEMRDAFQTYADYEKDKRKREEQAQKGPQPIPKNLIARIKKEKINVIKDYQTGKDVYIINENLYNDILYIKSHDIVNKVKTMLPEYAKYNVFSVEILDNNELLVKYTAATDRNEIILVIAYHINFTYKTYTDIPTANYLDSEYIFVDGTTYHSINDIPFAFYEYFQYIKTHYSK